MLLQNPLPVEKRCPRWWSWGLACVLLAVSVLLGGVSVRADAADTIIIIIPGKQAEPAKDKVADTKKPALYDILRFTDEARKAGIVLKLDDKGNIQPADPLQDPSIRARYRLLADPRKQQPPGPQDPELKKILEVLQELQKTRPDSKELRDLIERLKAWKATTPVPTREKLQNLYDKGVLPKGLAFSPDGKTLLSSSQESTIRVWDAVTGKQLQKGQVDWKRLVMLLEQIQKAPDKVDPKEISNALEAIRKAAANTATRYAPARALVTKSDTRGRFGIRFSPPSNDLREHLGLPKDQGLVIEEVISGTPAAKAGLKVRDIVLKLNDQPVPSDTNKALKLFADVKDGTSVDLTILRRGKEEVIKGIKPASADAAILRRWVTAQVRYADADTVPEKGAVVSIRSDGGKFTATQREKNLTITINGTLKDGKTAKLEILIQVEGKEAFRGSDAATVPEAWRQRVNRLLELIRGWQAGSQSPAPVPRFRDPLPKGAKTP